MTLVTSPGYRVMGTFGKRPPIQTSQGKSAPIHEGIDIAPKIPGTRGEPLYALMDGPVTTFTDAAGALVVQIGSLQSGWRYYHCEKFLVRSGDFVRRGDRIALMGMTGRVTGIHVHLERWIGGRRVDPAPHLAALADKKTSPTLTPVIPEEDDVALTDREKQCIEALWQLMPQLQQVAARYGTIDQTAAMTEQLFNRRAQIDQMSVAVEAIRAQATDGTRVTAEQIAAALPDAIAADVAAELAKRLSA